MSYAESLKTEGKQEGIALGEQKALTELAKRMLKSGYEEKEIMKLTKLSEKELKRLS